MPHIGIKMLKGRTPEQKEKLSAALVKTLVEQLGCSESHVRCTIEDFTAQEWQEIFEQEVTEKSGKLYKKPEYNPKDLL